MQCITGWTSGQRRWGAIVHTIAVLGLIWVALKGVRLESLGGWVACPPRGSCIGRQGPRARRRLEEGVAWSAAWAWMRRSWPVAWVRSEVLLLLAVLPGHEEWVCLLPWASWLWRGVGAACPRWRGWVVYRGVEGLLEEAGRLALYGLALGGVLDPGPRSGPGRAVRGLGLGSLAAGPGFELTEEEEGICHLRLYGAVELHLDGKVPFYKRMLVIFARLLEAPGETRGGRRTRDGRTPFVRQQELAQQLGVPQPDISRWMRYWQTQDWRRLHSGQRWDVLTRDVQQRVLATWVQFPWWGAEQLWQHLQAQGERISLRDVRRVAQESGWSVLRVNLRRLYAIRAESFRPRDEWLVSHLLGQVQELVTQLEQVGAQTPEQRMTWADLEAWSAALDIRPAVVRAPLPWVLQLEHMLWGHWEPMADDTVRCLYCGSTQVSRKSKTPRWKRYVDEHGHEQRVAVYRYYCHNPACAHQTFTNLPPNLVPYSKWTLQHHLAALQSYAWSHSVYRCTGQLLGVSKMTAYRWVSSFGHQLLPVAALLGVVRSSGVIGVDEKYVLVPKNDKPEAQMKRWMYVYFAVDCYTYDLLHIEIYPYNTKQSAQAFLLALRAKGYHPRVVVTDLRADYGPLVADVFPQATHHECIFHALQDVHQHLREVYGPDYATTQPQVETLRQEIEHIFAARTKRTAQRRYEQVLAQRETFVTQTPGAEAVFDFLERHGPQLVNAIESRLIPTTNNACEEVIRIFTQHYKTFCGFENIETARLYLGVFEKVYRFTPFSDDAQERIRGRCPLELAGYEVQKLPMVQLFRGLALQWPAAAFQELVPNV
jgi:transposase-like protein